MDWPSCGLVNIMRIHRVIRMSLVLIAAVALVGAILLWVWTLDIHDRPVPTPAVAVRLPSVLLQAAALEEGLQLLAVNEKSSQSSLIEFGRATKLGNAGYHHGYMANVLGLVVAVLPTTHSGGDYRVPPHAEVVLPYWLIVIGSGAFLLISTPIATRFVCGFRWSWASVLSAGVTGLIFLALNLFPSRSGSVIRPRPLHEWVLLILDPSAAYPTAMFVYGFPLSCYRRATVNGQAVDWFYGADMGWEPNRLMENVCLGVLAACAMAWLAEWIRRRIAGDRRR